MGGRRRAMRGATEGAGDGWQTTGLHRLRDRDPAEGGVCPIGGARGPLIAQANPMGGSVGAVPRGSPDASASIAAVCNHCATSHLVQYPSLTSNCGSSCPPDTHANAPRDNTRPQPANQRVTSRGYYTRYGALHPLRGATPVTGRCTRCVALHPLRGAAPDQNGCNAYGSGVPRSQTRTTAEPGTPQHDGIPQHEGKRPQRPYIIPGTWQANQVATSRGRCSCCVVLHPLRGATPVTGRCSCCVVLHPLCGAAPVMWCCTRSERVQCIRIGCTALADKNDRGTWNPTT